MKCMIPEISWHNREPILCIDIQPLENDFYRLATGGSDNHVLIWHGKIAENGAVVLDIVADLTRHQRAVNAVRWSPNGQYLASADDDANIIIWNLKTDNIPLLEGDTNDKETWIISKIMRGHKEDIYDLCWSPDSLKILTGSIDNTAIIWDFTKGKSENILTVHKGFVQGVCWDPKGEFIATLSSDRVCRVFEGNGKQARARISRGVLPVPKSHPLYKKEVKYFHDDTFKSYFRRLSFTPDGSLIVAPTGCIESDDNKKAFCGTYLFSLDCLTQPVAILPLQNQCSVAVRCCPILYELMPNGPDPVVNLPYRMIIAIAAESDLILYDTQQLAPFAYLQKLHYTRLTDLTWSMDGRLLAASSTDGFCTLLTFEAGELGTPYTKEESEMDESFLNISGCEELEKEPPEVKKEEKSKRESFLLQWANKIKEDDKNNSNKSEKINNLEECKENEKDNENKISEVVEANEIKEKADSKRLSKSGVCQKDIETISITDSPEKSDKTTEIWKSPVKKTPRRIVPIRLSSPANAETKKNTPASKATTAKRKRKSIDSPQNKEIKKNSLINFLKVTTPDKSKTVGDVHIGEESTNARDAWGNDEMKDKDEKIETAEVDDLTEPTPDFKLQLEESTLKEENNHEILDAANVEMKDEQKEIGNKEVSVKLDENIMKINTKLQSDVKVTEPKKGNENNLKRTGRRIQLITLSSPKHKRQKNT